MALLLSQHKMIDWLTKQISKYGSLISNNNKQEVKKAKQVEEQEFGRENAMITLERMEEFNILRITINVILHNN
jgi:hypothetical protein